MDNNNSANPPDLIMDSTNVASVDSINVASIDSINVASIDSINVASIDSINVASIITENGNNGVEERVNDTTDARLGSIFNVLTGRSNHGTLSVHPESLDYLMLHSNRGKCVIFNNKRFEAGTQLLERKGSDKDAESLKTCFQSLDFDVEIVKDASAIEVKGKLRDLSQEDHSRSDCLVVCVLSHGEQGMIWGRDSRYLVDELYIHFTGEKCPSLAGKPKLFFIQACQGSNFDRGVAVRSHDTTDAATYYKIPTWADFLMMYSTVPGYYSWRNPSQGSWFIQALVSILKENSHSMDLLSILTLVNRRVAYEFESFCPGQGDFDGNKQVPCITSMLTRRVFFPTRV